VSNRNLFLPVNQEDMQERGWEQLDFLFISGDAYVDHPSFSVAVISRLLEKEGYKTGVIAQPDWRSTADFKKLGKPRLGVLVSAGNLDSMLNKYTAAKKYRKNDSYSPGGKAGLRPDRATIVYCQRIRELWKSIPLIIGGIEASLRRFAHYDYWSDNVRRSILIDSKADILIYGMGERQIKEIAAGLSGGLNISEFKNIPGTVSLISELQGLSDYIEIPSFEDVKNSREDFALAFKLEYLEQDAIRGKALAQKHGDEYILQNPPALPLTTAELDEIYELDYVRNYHPMYEKEGGVPAIEEVKFSLVSQRGCYGGCSFCALSAHQGRIIQPRSHDSILHEAKTLTSLPDFKGYIHDVGGPTANFRTISCQNQITKGTCREKQCLFPKPCRNLKTGHSDYLNLLRSLRKLPGVKKVFVRSGLRYDYLLTASDKEFLRELCEHHVSGQLKVAPEHISPKVTHLMGKQGKEVYLKFKRDYEEINKSLDKKQYLVPYFMSGHPGSGLKEAVELAEFIRDQKYNPEQVQDFIPTPGTLSTCMYYTGLNPLTGQKVYTVKNPGEKSMQRALMQYKNPKNYNLVHEALVKAGREDLIGYGAKCLIRPPGRQNAKILTSRGDHTRSPASKKRKLPPTRQKTGKK